MKSIAKKITTIGICAVLGACGGAPSFVDIEPELTPAVLALKVRCELLDAAEELVTQQLRRPEYRQQPSVLALFARFPSQNIPLIELLGQTVKGDAGFLLDQFAEAQVAYVFTLFAKSTVDNKADINLLARLIDAGESVGFKANKGLKIERQNEQKFRIGESFKDLASLNRKRCAENNEILQDVHFVSLSRTYPIAGRIGLHRILTDFYELSVSQNLDNREKPGTPPVVTNEVEFATTVSAGGGFNVTAPPNLGAPGLNLGSTYTRFDRHRLTVSFAFRTDDAQKKALDAANELDLLNSLDGRGAVVLPQGIL
ncbi:MAG: hypothetical protein AAF318_10445 [Pseudomonadota bacterium]